MLSKITVATILALGVSVSASAVPGQRLEARHTEGDCSVEPAGAGPVTNNPDTAEAFQANPVYAQSASNAVTPSGYSSVYQNLLNATTTDNYLGFEYLSSYDPAYCASQCTNSWKGCDSFNIYFERDPTLDSGVNCPNPPSLTYIKCSYWSSCIDKTSAINAGQYCQDFHVVIAGSNGYTANSACTSGSTTTTAATTSSATATTTSKAATSTTSMVATTTSAAAGWSNWGSWPSSNPKPSGPLTSCPQPLGYIVPGPGRTLYAICLDTDYQIPSPQIYYNVVDNRACGNQCDQTSGCTKAVYNPSSKTCYLKGNPSTQNANWQSNPGFQTLERIPDGTPITSCLAPTYPIVQNGKTWTVCPASNFFNNPATDIWYGITSEYACAAKCQSTKGCGKFVYNWNTQTCYNKGNPALANTQWTVQSGVGSYYTS